VSFLTTQTRPEGHLKMLARRALASAGLNVRREFSSVDGFPQRTVTPFATYAPWAADAAFIDTYRAVVDHTLVDIYRCWELWQLVEQVSGLQGGFVEVGVWRGGSGCLIAKRAKLLGLDADVFLCDTFTGVVKTGDLDPAYDGGEHADTSVKIVRDLAARLGVDNVVLAEGIFPDETQHIVTAQQIRLLHVDVDVYVSARDIVDFVWPRLVRGGVVVFDDYGFKTTTGITKYVNEAMRGQDRTMVHNLNGHAVVIKTA
jgi:O-methyltransferase